MKEAILYDQLDDNQIHCRVCNHFCTISPGQVGVCGVRQNKDGKLYSLIYAKAISANVDPIEKKPLYHFLPGSRAFSIGTMGCNFRCQNCQNFSISQIQGIKGEVDEYNQVYWGQDLPPERVVELAQKNNCQSIAYTYTEPTIFIEYALETMKLAHKQGLKNVWVSNGFMSDKTLDEIIPYLDAINVDIKSMDEEFYEQVCGARLKPVLENCQRLAKSDVWLEVTTLVIPNLSDDPDMLRELAEFIKNKLGKDTPWHISAFSSQISWQLQDLPDTSVDKIKDVYEIGKRTGLNYVYGGNIPGSEMQSTRCPQCGQTVIERGGYRIEKTISQGDCSNCGQSIAGIF